MLRSCSVFSLSIILLFLLILAFAFFACGACVAKCPGQGCYMSFLLAC